MVLVGVSYLLIHEWLISTEPGKTCLLVRVFLGDETHNPIMWGFFQKTNEITIFNNPVFHEKVGGRFFFWCLVWILRIEPGQNAFAALHVTKASLASRLSSCCIARLFGSKDVYFYINGC